MSSEPLVTIIVPVYNNEAYIRDCVEALLEQTYRKIQIIFVNDGSTDATYEICKSFEDDRILLLSKDNGGASSARNMGMRYAKGEYIYFADSDDFLEKHAIEKLVDIAIKEKADCVFFEANNYTEEKEIKVKQGGLLQKTDYEIQSGNQLILQLLKNKDYHAAPFLYFVHHAIYNELFFEEGIMFEDELFIFQMLRRCERVVSLREQLYNRRVRSGSVMTAKGKGLFRFFSISKVLQKIFELYEKEPENSVIEQYIIRISLLWYGYWRALDKKEKGIKEKDYIEMRQKILKYKGFGSRELIIRCYGYYAWLIYIFPGRCIRRLRHRRLK